MADKKISALTGATTPLAGTEVLPIVQGGSTVKVSVANLTAGRAVSAASVTASTGNFVVGTSGQGIDFSATPGTGSSKLLADYEEGTWTPTDGSGAGLSLTVALATYTKVGRLVTCSCEMTYPATANGANTTINGLPFASLLNSAYGGFVKYTTRGSTIIAQVSRSTATYNLYDLSGNPLTNANMSGVRVDIVLTYIV